ncbi:MAG: outer membrane lipoprotein-sorting protein [Burkholderiaceae bacterium]|jgi:outer membrane lipoprotein-sorting protein|nr:outer membrane lipoprotein-sorting protein [Burkholderiaceae bacterium]
MKTITLIWAALAAALALHPVTAAEMSARQRLQQADGYRGPADDMQLDVRVVAQTKDGGEPKERRYTVFVQAGHKSLVLMQNPAERGQKVLMLGDDYWIIMPGSTRPMRITPMQKLLGEVAAGDISNLRWSEDYSAAEAGEESIDGAPAVRLTLQANRKGVTYQRIELWVGKERSQPLKADFYVQSDKLAKSAAFVLDDPAKPTRVTAMALTDALGNNRETRVFYSGQKPRTVPQAWLNPMFLANNPELE